MGKKKRILFNPKFAHLKEARFGSDTQKEKPHGNFAEQQKLEEQEPVKETPVLKLAEKELAPKLVEEKEEKPLLKKEAPPLGAVKVTKKVTPHKTKVTAKKKTTTKARAKKTTSKK